MLDAITTKSEQKVLTAKKSLDKEIEEFKQRKVKPKGRVKRYFILIALAALVGISFYGMYKINQFFESNKLVFQSPVKVGFYAPVYIAKREKPEVVTIVQEITGIKPNSPLNDIQQYICDKFGKDCKLALAVAKAENGTMQCDRFNINSNGTVDFGVFQINTVHLKKGYKISDLIDCKKNVDIAFEIFSQQKGFQAWVAYNNGNYKKFMY